MSKFYITTPIYYVNSRPHLGHLYTTLVADTVARYQRQRGKETFFLTGTDEHGQNIERAAERAGVPVRQYVDEIVAEFQEMFPRFQLAFDQWIRTTDPAHQEGVRTLWRRVRDNGFIYKGQYEGWYCVGCNGFLSEDETVPGPNDQPVCRTHERPLERLAEESYFFRLSAFQEKLLAWYKAHPEFIQPESRRNEVLRFVEGGLHDLSVSRVSVKWGIPVPDDPAHTMYVWFDALSNYITAIGYGNQPHGGTERFDQWWPANLQLVGKDILRFHTIYWPAFLLAADLAPPRTVFAHGFWLSGGRKMSKTLGNVIDLHVLRRHFSPDAVRYFCLREMVFGQDGDFTYEALIERINAELADGLGNLSSRVLTMVQRFCEGTIPEIPPSNLVDDEVNQRAELVRQTIENVTREFDREFEAYNFSRALEGTQTAIATVDKFLSDLKPWKMGKALASDPRQREALDLVLATSVLALRRLSALLAPVLPESTQSIWTQLGEQGMIAQIRPGDLPWVQPPGQAIGDVSPIFPKLDKKTLMEEITKEESAAPVAEVETAAAAPTAPVVPVLPPVTEVVPGVATITIDDFTKVELRAGEIKTAERVPKADKLLRMTIDLGESTPRQILAGIAQYYEPEALIGRKVIVVANLAPRKLRGLESQGMVLAASVGDEGRPILAGFLEEVPNGARLR
jgi:methionyl-tRNA synthetase